MDTGTDVDASDDQQWAFWDVPPNVDSSSQATPAVAPHEQVETLLEDIDLFNARTTLRLLKHAISNVSADRGINFILTDAIVFHIRHVWLNRRHCVIQDSFRITLGELCNAWYLTDVSDTKEVVASVEKASQEAPNRIPQTALRKVFARLPKNSKVPFIVAMVLSLVVIGCTLASILIGSVNTLQYVLGGLSIAAALAVPLVPSVVAFMTVEQHDPLTCVGDFLMMRGKNPLSSQQPSSPSMGVGELSILPEGGLKISHQAFSGWAPFFSTRDGSVSWCSEGTLQLVPELGDCVGKQLADAIAFHPQTTGKGLDATIRSSNRRVRLFSVSNKAQNPTDCYLVVQMSGAEKKEPQSKEASSVSDDSSSGHVTLASLLSRLEDNSKLSRISVDGAPDLVPQTVESVVSEFVSASEALVSVRLSAEADSLRLQFSVEALSNKEPDLAKSRIDISSSSLQMVDSMRGSVNRVGEASVDVFVPLYRGKKSLNASSMSSIGRSNVDVALHGLYISKNKTEADSVIRNAGFHGCWLIQCSESEMKALVEKGIRPDFAIIDTDSVDMQPTLSEKLVSACKGPLFWKAKRGNEDPRWIRSVDERTIGRILSLVEVEVSTATASRQSNSLLSGDITHVSYTLKRKLGSGTFGDVYLVELPLTGGQVALKRIDVTKDAGVKRHIRNVTREAEIMSKLNHQNIVRFLHVERESGSLSIFMEYCDGGNLSQYVGAPDSPVDEICRWIKEIISGIAYLHANGVVHRDIKPENVYLRNGHAKLGDFGLAKQPKSSMGASMGGTLAFMAPEIVLEESYGSPCDIWSIGCVVAQLLGVTIHTDTGFYHLVELYKSIPATSGIVLSHSVPPNIAGFIQSCLQRDPSRRPTAENLLESPLLNAPELLKTESLKLRSSKDTVEASQMCNMSLLSESS